MDREITQTNMADTLMDYIDQASRGTLLDLYNQVAGTNYTYEDVDWDN